MRSGCTQSSPTANPDIRVQIGADVYTSQDSGRLVYAYEDEQAWGGRYVFHIDNSDNALNNKDYKGKVVTVYHGFIGSTGSQIGALWVDTQEFISLEGKLLLQLNCIDIWGLMTRVKGVAGGAYWNHPWQNPDELAKRKLMDDVTPIPQDMINKISAHWNKNVKDIVSGTIDKAVERSVVWTAADSYCSSEKPMVAASDPRSLVIQAMDVTGCYLLWKADGYLHAINPGAQAVAYSYNAANLIFNNVEEQMVVTPNRVIVWYIDKTTDPEHPENWIWEHSNWEGGVGVDTESHGRLVSGLMSILVLSRTHGRQYLI